MSCKTHSDCGSNNFVNEQMLTRIDLKSECGFVLLLINTVNTIDKGRRRDLELSFYRCKSALLYYTFYVKIKIMSSAGSSKSYYNKKCDMTLSLTPSKLYTQRSG